MRKHMVLILFGLALAACSGAAGSRAPTVEAPPKGEVRGPAASETIYVYKSSTCGCCENWVGKLVEYGFDVQVEDVNNLPEIKKDYGIPAELQSCHTAVVGEYIIEGHVPPADIERLLAEQPDAVGLAVPGMVVGSPGMEVPGSPGQPYDVILFDESGPIAVFASYNLED